MNAKKYDNKEHKHCVFQIFGTIPWQSYFQRVLSVQSGSKARALSIAGAFCSLALVVPSIFIGAASTVAGEFVCTNIAFF